MCVRGCKHSFSKSRFTYHQSVIFWSTTFNSVIVEQQDKHIIITLKEIRVYLMKPLGYKYNEILCYHRISMNHEC